MKSGLTERQVVKYLSIFSCIGPVGETRRDEAREHGRDLDLALPLAFRAAK